MLHFSSAFSSEHLRLKLDSPGTEKKIYIDTILSNFPCILFLFKKLGTNSFFREFEYPISNYYLVKDVMNFCRGHFYDSDYFKIIPF